MGATSPRDSSNACAGLGPGCRGVRTCAPGRGRHAYDFGYTDVIFAIRRIRHRAGVVHRRFARFIDHWCRHHTRREERIDHRAGCRAGAVPYMSGRGSGSQSRRKLAMRTRRSFACIFDGLIAQTWHLWHACHRAATAPCLQALSRKDPDQACRDTVRVNPMTARCAAGSWAGRRSYLRVIGLACRFKVLETGGRRWIDNLSLEARRPSPALPCSPGAITAVSNPDRGVDYALPAHAWTSSGLFDPRRQLFGHLHDRVTNLEP